MNYLGSLTQKQNQPSLYGIKLKQTPKQGQGKRKLRP